MPANQGIRAYAIEKLWSKIRNYWSQIPETNLSEEFLQEACQLWAMVMLEEKTVYTYER